MGPKNRTPVVTQLATTPDYNGHEEVRGSVVDEDITVKLFGTDRQAELYSITHTRYGTEVTQQILVITDQSAPDVAYLYVPDQTELEGGQARPPYTILAAGRRWVPCGVQDSVQIWDITGSERDYSDTAIGLLEAYWVQGARVDMADVERGEAEARLDTWLEIDGSVDGINDLTSAAKVLGWDRVFAAVAQHDGPEVTEVLARLREAKASAQLQELMDQAG